MIVAWAEEGGDLGLFLVAKSPSPIACPIHPFKKMLPSLLQLICRSRQTEEGNNVRTGRTGLPCWLALAAERRTLKRSPRCLPFPFMPHNDSSRRCRPSPGITRISAISPSQSECSAQKRQTRKDRNISWLWWHKAKRRKEGRRGSFRSVPSPPGIVTRPRPSSAERPNIERAG